ncbi:helix-turn-helix domain-containing protein [Lactococcus garvieae]
MNKKLRHQDRVLNYIKEFGSITSAECFTELGIIDLPKKICLLQDEGYIFKKNLLKRKIDMVIPLLTNVTLWLRRQANAHK